MGRLRTRMSFRMRILIPWSAREHERGVDSDDDDDCRPIMRPIMSKKGDELLILKCKL